MNFPNGINLKDISLTVYSPSFYSESQSLIGHSRAIPASRFEVTFKTVAINTLKARELWGFINSLRGRLTPFSMVLPTVSNSLGNIVNNANAKSALNAGTKTATLKTLPASVNNLMLAGDVIKFAGHNKVYALTQALNANAAGEGVINFEPRLQENVTLNEVVMVNNVPFNLRLRSDKSVFERKVTDQGYVVFSFDCIEAI